MSDPYRADDPLAPNLLFLSVTLTETSLAITLGLILLLLLDIMTIIIVLRSRFFGSRLRSVGSDVVSVRLASRPQLLICGTNVVHLFKIRIVCNTAVAISGALCCAARKPPGESYRTIYCAAKLGRVRL